MHITIFDTETTGLLSKNLDFNNLTEDDLSECPYILQFSYINYYIEENKISMFKDDYVLLPNDIEIPEESIKIHGITQRTINKKGIDIQTVILDFMYVYKNKTDKLICHNVEFDIKMLLVELMRLFYKTREDRWSLYYNLFLLSLTTNTKFYCTMKNSVSICNIYVENKYGHYYKKYPKLSELFYHLFKENPKNLHNSLIDCFCCLRCYMQLVYHYDILHKNRSVKELFKLLN